jgi:hypothetical protein
MMSGEWPPGCGRDKGAAVQSAYCEGFAVGCVVVMLLAIRKTFFFK